MPLDWNSEESHIFANPQLWSSFFPSQWAAFNDYPGHIWIATSGTTQIAEGSIKWVALSKKAFLASAAAVNQHLHASKSDVWLNALPLFHVGGLSILARAHLSSAKVEALKLPKWSKDEFMQALNNAKATLASLVPAQIYDLVEAGYTAPSHLRGVIIGGGAFPLELFQKAISLKWPVMPSFGMTECCSQIATAILGEYDLTILSHMKCSVSIEGLLQIQSPALLTGYLTLQHGQFNWHDPKVKGVLTTEDFVEIQGNTLKFLGRKSDRIKIGGENVSFFHLETFFNKIKPSHIDAVLHPADDPRLGKIIELVTLKTNEGGLAELIHAFNSGVMPYEKIRNIRFVESIPRSALGKVLRGKLVENMQISLG